MTKDQNLKDVDHYIASFPSEIQERLNQVRKTILAVAPNAVECISYQMPAYKLNGMLVYFAGYERHIGFYPGASGIAKFKDEISYFKHAKGSVQFPHSKPLPLELIATIVKYRVQGNIFKAKSKQK